LTEIPALGAVEGKLHQHFLGENALVISDSDDHAILFSVVHV